MSQWAEVEDHVMDVLESFHRDDVDHLGQPFVSPYQIAIRFVERYPDAANELGMPVGGVGSNTRRTLARYFAEQLSSVVRNGHPRLEGTLLARPYFNDVIFNNNGAHIRASLSTDYAFSLFRLRD